MDLTYPSQHFQFTMTRNFLYHFTHLNSANSWILSSFEEFTLFPKLPIEIRFMVWDLTLPDSQIITVNNVGERNGKPEIEHFVLSFRSFSNLRAKASYKIPVALHTTTESRCYAKTHFSMAFEHQLGGNPIYFNVSKDLLVVEDGLALMALLGGFPSEVVDRKGQWQFSSGYGFLDCGNQEVMTDVFEKVRKLAINTKVAWKKGPMALCLPMFKNLEILKIVKATSCKSDYYDFKTNILPLYSRAGKIIHGNEHVFPMPELFTKVQLSKLVSTQLEAE